MHLVLFSTIIVAVSSVEHCYVIGMVRWVLKFLTASLAEEKDIQTMSLVKEWRLSSPKCRRVAL